MEPPQNQLSEGLGFGQILLIIIVATTLLGLVGGAISSGIYWGNTGNGGPFADATIGQLLYWDGAIDTSMQLLENPSALSSLPVDYQSQLISSLAKEILYYLSLFLVVVLILYMAADWIAGSAEMTFGSRIAIFLIIISIIGLGEFAYGLIFHKTNIIPFKGLYDWLVNFNTWWNAMAGTIIKSVVV